MSSSTAIILHLELTILAWQDGQQVLEFTYLLLSAGVTSMNKLGLHAWIFSQLWGSELRSLLVQKVPYTEDHLPIPGKLLLRSQYLCKLWKPTQTF